MNLEELTILVVLELLLIEWFFDFYLPLRRGYVTKAMFWANKVSHRYHVCPKHGWERCKKTVPEDVHSCSRESDSVKHTAIGFWKESKQ